MGAWTGTVPSHAAGAKSKASKLQTIDDILTALTGSWTDFSASFTITASVTPPTKGNSTYTAAYVQVGKTVDYTFSVTVGSTFVAGSGDYRFLLPVTAVMGSCIGVVRILDSGTSYYVAALTMQNSTHLEAVKDGSATLVGSAGPGTAWATGDIIRGQIRYEAA
jgi:hypothetical protein